MEQEVVDWSNLVYVLVVVVIYFFLVVLPFWRIFSKAGYNGSWAILMVTPFAPVAILYFALFDWPVSRRRTAGR